jgi:hypothetical protein
MSERVRFDADVYKAIGGAVEFCDTYEELRHSGVRYTTHAVAQQQVPTWLGFRGDIDLGSVKFADREGCSRSVLVAAFDGQGVWFRQGFYRGSISLRGPGISDDLGTAFRPWTSTRDPATGRPSDVDFKPRSGVYVTGQTGSVLIDLPDILASLTLRWAPTDEPVTPPRDPSGTVTPAPLLDEIRSERTRQGDPVELHNSTILYLIVDQVIARNEINDPDGAYMAELLNTLQADGYQLMQKGAGAWDKRAVQRKRADVKTQLGKLGYRSSTHYAFDKQLPFGTINGLAWRAQQHIDARA